jgi:DNA primase
MNTLDRYWEFFCSKLEKVEQTSNGIKALCPAHDDENPSLTASCNSEKILVKCQAGCTFKEIVTAVGMKQSQFFTPKEKIPPKRVIQDTYRYEDKDGNHVMDVVRFKPKDFRQRGPDGKWTLDGVTRVPYRLPQLLAGIKEGREIIIVEGEKDCDNAEKFGLVTTTFAGGTGKWREEYSKWFQEAKVICLPDNDDAGRKGMHLIASQISKVAESVRWLELPNIPEKGDLSDWINIEGNNFESFNSLVEESSSTWTNELVKEDDNGQLLEELNQKMKLCSYLLQTLSWLCKIDLLSTTQVSSQDKSKRLHGGSLILNEGNMQVSISFQL